MCLISKVLRVLKNPKILKARYIELKANKKIDNIVMGNYRKNNDFFFIQIGSNDGKTGDPIHNYIIKYKWKGILVEPVKYLFKKLKRTYKDQKGLFFENSAINEKNGYKYLYRLEENDEPNNPIWYDQLGSFKKEVILKNKNQIPNFNNHLIKERVKCITFNNLLEKYDVKKIDLLHIDTEGYDYEIIKKIPFNKLKPRMILYEDKHLELKDKLNCIKLLKKNKYNIINKWGDTFAYLS